MSQAQPNPEDIWEQRKAEVEHQSASKATAERANRAGLDPRELMSREWMDTVNDLDIDRDLPPDHPKAHNLSEKLGAHTSKQIGIGYITHEEADEAYLRDRGYRRLLNASFRRAGGSGAACTGRTRERMTGGESTDLPQMEADLSDQLDAAFEAKKHLRSGSIEGRRFRGSTEVQVVTKNEGEPDFGGGDGGMLSRVTGGLMG